LNIKLQLDAETQGSLEALCNSYGITVSEAANVLLQKAVKDMKLPVKNKKTPKYNAETLAAIAETEDIIKNPQNYKAYETAAEFQKAMYSLLEKKEGDE
ncbi:MAG: type II toxin-antitoxin system RelB/DinJ family antitoxin, partial [Candidatus Cloacimonetes bacterium]|nr:type II toxin-antitoxin system RelB/DinJ family antitoxin [Candidatus Cloacimonadota bacterium]